MTEPTDRALKLGEDRALKALLRLRRPDGGHGYRPGQSSFTAPSALACMALARPDPDRCDGDLRWLLRSSNPDGSYGVLPGDSEGTWMTAPALLALATAPDERLGPVGRRIVEAGMRWMLERNLAYSEPGVTVPGWPWTPGTARWVEPTAWHILALGAGGYGSHRRVREAAAYLRDQMTRSGGWSLYDLRPYLYHTALVALALQGLRGFAPLPPQGAARGPADGSRESSREALARAMQFILSALPDQETTDLDRGFSLLAMARRPPSESLPAAGPAGDRAAAALLESQRDDGSWGEGPWDTAVAVLGLRAWRTRPRSGSR